MSTSQGIAKNGDVVDLPEEEIRKMIAFRPHAIEVLEAESEQEKSNLPARSDGVPRPQGITPGFCHIRSLE